MARPTRNPPSLISFPAPVDLKSKKRKREPSLAGDVLDGRPAAKLPKADTKPEQNPLFEPEYLDPHDAHKILTILETVDTNGFLDRIFDVPSSSTAPPASLRTLLREPGRRSVDVLRNTLQALLPLSSQPRALLAPVTAEQQCFVELSNNLLDQALTRSGLSKSMDVVLQGRDEQAPELDADERKRVYTLVQRLPSGDWWSSATIPKGGSVGITRAEASALPTKQAELAMVVPSLPLLSSEVPTLGTLKPPVLKPSKDPGWQETYLPQRKLHAPKLLDWGPYMTFAPAYDAADCELGPGAAFQTTYESIVRRKARVARKQLEEKMRRKEEAERKEHMSAVDSGDVEMSVGLDPAEDDPVDLTVQTTAEKGEPGHIISSAREENGEHFSAHETFKQLHGLFSPDEAEALKEAFQLLELELGVSELLHYIITSLQRLVDMQRERLVAGIELEHDSLEHQIAQGVTKSLALLVSMRPRTYEQPNKSLIPPAAILHALHRSLPAQPTTGWRGTLAGHRPTALRDDTTVTIKSTARAQAAAQAASQLYPQSTPSQPVSTPASYPNGTPAAPNFGRGGPMPSPMTPGPFMGPYGNYYPNYYSGYPSPAPTPGPYGGARPIPDMTKSQGQPPVPKGWQGYHHGPVPPAPSASAIPPHMTGVFRPGVPPSANKSFYR